MPPTPVEVASVESRTVREQFRAIGGIEADEVIQVTTEVPGVVRQLPFTEGRLVAAGALLARLDDREAAANAARAKAQRELAESNARRATALAQQQVISEQSLEDTRAALKIAQANEAQAEAQLAKMRIRAPWAGLVGRRRVSVGAYVQAADPITELARVDRVRVQFSAPERYLNQLRVGTPVEITTPAFPGRAFGGRLTVVDPIVDPQTRSVHLVAEFRNPQHVLKSGLSANVTVTFSERPMALVVPDEAIFAEGAQSYVFVVKPDSTVARAAIQTGLRDSSRVEVTRGLEAGQQIVKAGHQKLFDGAKVIPIPSAMMAGGMPPGGGGAGAAKDTSAGSGGGGSGTQGKAAGGK
jgi:membrane fusion protein (multidrug efflux system)